MTLRNLIVKAVPALPGRLGSFCLQIMVILQRRRAGGGRVALRVLHCPRTARGHPPACVGSSARSHL